MSEEKRGMLSAGRPSNVRKSATLASLSDITTRSTCKS